MSYTKLNNLCKSVSSALVSNRKFYPENSEIYNKNPKEVQLCDINVKKFTENNFIPKDIKSFNIKPEVHPNNTNAKNCTTCSKY